MSANGAMAANEIPAPVDDSPVSMELLTDRS